MSNKHKNQKFAIYKSASGLDTNPNVKIVQTDSMPAEVATEMLCVPAGKGRMTNRERKTYQAARQRVYDSVLQAKSAEAVLALKMRNATWAQLVKWNQRAINRRADVQSAYIIACRRRDELQKKEVDPKNEQENRRIQIALAVLLRSIALLELKAEQLDMLWSAVDDEFTARKQKLKQVKPA